MEQLDVHTSYEIIKIHEYFCSLNYYTIFHRVNLKEYRQTNNVSGWDFTRFYAIMIWPSSSKAATTTKARKARNVRVKKTTNANTKRRMK